MLEAVKEESKRTILTILIPGFVIVLPWAIYFINQFMDRELLKEGFGAVAAAIFLFSLAIGMICENIGSTIEKLIDVAVKCREKDFQLIWEKYLDYEEEQGRQRVISRYYSSLVIRYKFELNFLAAIPAFGYGLYWLSKDGFLTKVHPNFNLTTSSILFLLWCAFVRWAFKSALYLHDLRKKYFLGNKEL